MKKILKIILSVIFVCPSTLVFAKAFNPHEASPRDIFALTVLSEARGERERGQKAVIVVIVNRANRSTTKNVTALHVKKVCLAPKQFSFWNEIKQVWRLLDSPMATQRIYYYVDSILSGRGMDISDIREFKTATHFYSGKVAPYWASAPNMKYLGQIGGLKFFEEQII